MSASGATRRVAAVQQVGGYRKGQCRSTGSLRRFDGGRNLLAPLDFVNRELNTARACGIANSLNLKAASGLGVGKHRHMAGSRQQIEQNVLPLAIDPQYLAPQFGLGRAQTTFYSPDRRPTSAFGTH